MTDHLVVGDPHADPKVPNDRFDYLGNMIAEKQPDVVVCLGDFGNCNSISDYEKGTNWKDDVECVVDALTRINRPIVHLNKGLAKRKVKQYKPRMVMLGGNHDEKRINRFLERYPEMKGTVSLDDLQYEQFGWEYVPYEDPIIIDGISYCHHMPSGNMGQPMSGANLANLLITKFHMSVAVGHTHIHDYKMQVRADGKKLHGLDGGCFMDPKYFPTYASKPQRSKWWSGINMLVNVDDGDYDLEMYSFNRVKDMFK